MPESAEAVSKEKRPSLPGLKNMSLSPRLSEVAAGVAEGKSNKEIASDMDISVNTVGFHMKRLFNELGVSNRAQAILRLLRGGISCA